MCTATEFFETKSSAELSEFLVDAFDRHSKPGDIYLNEIEHIGELGRAIEIEFKKHPTNKTLSHEMWAVAAIRSQFKRVSDPNAKMPELLGAKVYNNPAFSEAFIFVRENMSATRELMRA